MTSPGIRYTQRDLVVRCREFIQALYHEGEEISEYFVREVAPSNREGR